MPITEFQLTVDRRELAAIQAGLRLLEWVNGSDSRIVPASVAYMVADVTSEIDTIEPLSDAEVRELAGRLTI